MADGWFYDDGDDDVDDYCNDDVAGDGEYLCKWNELRI